MTDWFEQLTGFRESGYAATRARLEVVGARLRSTVNQRSYGIGRLETPSLKELRERAQPFAGALAGRLAVSNVVGDVGALHEAPSNQGALFQVASQFNLLEMTGPDVTPEHGVSIYAHDHTQGPACAMAAGAATIYRNYFAPVHGQVGQTASRQIDCLHELGMALGNGSHAPWSMRNGYALCTDAGLTVIDGQLSRIDAVEHGALRDRLRVGLHWQVEVTSAAPSGPVVSQAFCSALPVAYCQLEPSRWQRFASLVLEGAYESTLWAAVLNAAQGGSRRVYLTLLGGGAFGNDTTWIHAALHRALQLFKDIALDVRIVSYREPARELQALVGQWD